MQRLCPRSITAVPLTLLLIVALSSAQQDQPGWDDTSDVLSSTPQVLGNGAHRFRVVPLTGFRHPTALAFLPNGDMLVTERGGHLRIVRDFALDARPISGIPPVFENRFQGLWDIALHPRFEDNGLVYFTYARRNPDEPADLRDPSGAAVLARGRFDGDHRLTDVQDLFFSNTWISGATTARIVFDRDGQVLMSIGTPSRDKERGGPNRIGSAESAQDPGSHAGKVLRLNDDGSVPDDNPFVDTSDYLPEIYALGFRNPQGLLIHPQTGELWDVERPELRLAGYIVWAGLQREPDARGVGTRASRAVRARYGATVSVLDTGHYSLRNRHLYGRCVSRVERAPVYRRLEWEPGASSCSAQQQRVSHASGAAAHRAEAANQGGPAGTGRPPVSTDRSRGVDGRQAEWGPPADRARVASFGQLRSRP